MKKSLLFALIAAIGMSAQAETDASVTWTLSPTTADPGVGNNFTTSIAGYQNNFVGLDCNYSNIKVTASGYELHCGIKDHKYTAVYTLKSNHPGYTVTGFSVTITAKAQSTNSITINGKETTLNSTEAKTFTGTGNTFTIKGTKDTDNTQNFPVASSISVTLTPTGVTSALPTESGWYKIYNIFCNSHNYGGQQIYTMDNEHLHNSAYYAMAVAPTLTKAAAGYMYIDVQSGTYRIQSPNGHYINTNCTSSLTPVNITIANHPNFGEIRIGGNNTYWMGFQGGGKNLVGSGTDKTAPQTSGSKINRWAIIKVSDEDIAGYDIWTVNIDAPKGGSAVTNYVRAVYDSEHNKGMTSVFNGGKFFVTKGTPISESDIHFDTAGSPQVNAPAVTIDNVNHTITATFSTEVLTNRYVRLNAASDAKFYYDMTVGGNPKFSTTPETAIYFYDANKRLVHYGEGRAAKSTDNDSNSHQLGGSTTAAQNANLTANAPEISFIVGTRFSPLRYYVVWDFTKDTSKYALLYCTAGTGAIGMGSIAKANNQINTAEALANTGWAFKVEYVTKLPVKIGEDGKGTLIAPVAVTAPETSDDFTFYTASTNSENNLVFTEVHGDIPANTPIVIKRSSSCTDNICNVAVNYNYTADEAELAALAETNERFIGSYLATVAPTPADNEVIYMKSATETATGDNDVVFSKVNAGATLPAGTIAFKAVKNSEEEAPATLSLDLTAANPGTTAINSIYVENEPASGAIYDLQGRRLSAPVKGINIINGRKVLVK